MSVLPETVKPNEWVVNREGRLFHTLFYAVDPAKMVAEEWKPIRHRFAQPIELPINEIGGVYDADPRKAARKAKQLRGRS